VVVAEDVTWAGVEVAVQVRTVSLLFLLLSCVLWAILEAPGVEFVAPSAEPVTRKCSLDDCFNSPAFFEAVLARSYVFGESVGA
jgi:hypothetical protein